MGARQPGGQCGLQSLGVFLARFSPSYAVIPTSQSCGQAWGTCSSLYLFGGTLDGPKSAGWCSWGCFWTPQGPYLLPIRPAVPPKKSLCPHNPNPGRLKSRYQPYKSNAIFGVSGRVPAYAYTIEFQKRGLPHAHILIILHPEDRFLSAAEVDATVSAEIPDQALHPNLYATVTRCMLHGNCSQYATSRTGTVPPCWDSDKNECSKRFPKDFYDHTVFEPDFGYPKYRRRRPAGVSEDESKQNCWVVPYNPYLSAKYDAHINVEVCASVKACKYIFKYVHKGADRASLRIQQADGQEDEQIDEVAEYRDARWVGSAEACWRIFGFKLHDHNPPLERLSIHLPNQQAV